MATALFISTTDLKKNSIIDGNVDIDKMLQFVKVAQQIDIQNLLGTDLYNKISADIIARQFKWRLFDIGKYIRSANINLVCADELYTICSIYNYKQICT